MAIYKKPFAGKTPAAPAKPVDSNTRTFDARPKPSDDRRREAWVRPGQHVDQFPADPLDKDETGEA